MKKHLFIMFVVPLLIVSSCKSNNQNESTNSQQTSNEEENLLDFVTSPEYDENVCLANDEVKEWVDNYYGFEEAGSSQKYQGKGDIYYPKPVNLTWESDCEYAYYIVKVGLDEELTDCKQYLTISNELTLESLYIHTQYFWKIYAYDENENLVGNSETLTFTTLSYPRTINLEGVSNTRDIGGKYTTEDRCLKQGMIYRSANLDSITEKGKNQFLYEYNIKTDLDLRNVGEGVYKTMSPVGKQVNYINMPGRYWTGGANGLDIESNFPLMKEELKVFTDVNNYPIMFHCAIGQDRTGSLALVLEALLGVNGLDMLIDYELSSFCSVVWDPASPIWVKDKLTYQYNPLFSYINSFGTEENSLMEKAELYCKQIGLTDEDIASIRDIMLED